jgi:hypothetical protein
MIGRLFNKMRKQRELDEQRERLRPQEEKSRAAREREAALHTLWESDEPWKNTRRIRCLCGNTVRYSIPELPTTFACTKCGGRQTLIR